ncbi:beta-mannosidase [Mucilaginibacter frigoritolerans]|uniref:Beta-mannosidase B n=1 Tax=Mucilaginibacter frigoritolerans TaxID=652788 RepID=A0A562UBM4_9SPHI|nr:glycoside hydrolase family 2 protein [Mucilaginibacter frigoritolerans]TWJ03190.1 beta-mannosidase [Mucilaginibacter frigoritolerans]
MKKTLSIIAACLLLGSAAFSQTPKIPIENGWEFHEYNGSKPELTEWRSATVPGLIHTDLLAYKLIPDPFYRDNEKKVQWVSDADWEYRKTISADQSLLKHKHIDLVFEGLNTVADVSLNGKLILHADNMFREWRVDIKSYLKQGNNTLAIIFHRIKPELARLDKAHPEEKEGADTSAVAKMFDAGNKSYVRKAAYEGGWDWGPNIVTCGIWRSVYLQCWENERIENIGIQQSDISTQAAHINVDVRVLSTVKADATLKVEYAQGSQTKSFSYPVTLHTGINEISYPIDIANPKLWYPNGYGKQDMYHFKATLLTGGHVADVVSTRSGLRSVRLNLDRDSLGRKFEFIVNGIPVFAKGASVIPFDHFPTRMTAERYRRFLQAGADAHMNMMRLWGGGYYETQEFYDLCDELGIMVWQDFMFANAVPPSFLKENIAKEIDYQVRRLRNHPCIAVWCGNNEISVFMENPDPDFIPDAFKPMFQKLAATRTSKTYTDYLEIFGYFIPGIVNKITPEIPYTSSSPTSDFERQRPNFISGDRHNYNVWWNNKTIEEQANYKDRFVSETGIQGFPDMATINAFTEPGDRSATSAIMNAHQKNASVNGNTVIEKIIKTEYKDPADFATFDYLAQLVQGESLKIYAEAMRRRRPFSMGFLYWQLNDSWPVISWATTDYYGRPKAGMYMAKHFFEPVLVSPHEEDGKINIYVVSDRTANEDASLNVRLMDFSGKVLWSKKIPCKVKALSSEIALSISKDELAGANYDPEKSFVSAKLVNANGDILSSNDLYFKRPKDLKYAKSSIQTDLSKQGDNYVLKITSNALAPRVGITFGDENVWLSDNYIDVLPNEPVLITVKSKASLEQLKSVLKVTALDQL